MDSDAFRHSPSDKLVHTPSGQVTMPQVAGALGVNYVMATRYIHRLEEAAILREITGQARNRAYRAGEVVDAIEEPLGQEGEPSPGDAP